MLLPFGISLLSGFVLWFSLRAIRWMNQIESSDGRMMFCALFAPGFTVVALIVGGIVYLQNEEDALVAVLIPCVVGSTIAEFLIRKYQMPIREWMGFNRPQ